MYTMTKTYFFCHKFCDDHDGVTNLQHLLFVITKPEKHHGINAMIDYASAI